MFVTLEDETGNVNVIVWPSLLEKQRKEALGASLLAVYGIGNAKAKCATSSRNGSSTCRICWAV